MNETDVSTRDDSTRPLGLAQLDGRKDRSEEDEAADHAVDYRLLSHELVWMRAPTL